MLMAAGWPLKFLAEKMVKVIINQEKCIKCGTCAAIYPDHFEAKNTHFKSKGIALEIQEAKNLASVCPVEAIVVEEK
ncbi:MAG: ferredoxin [Candidatus Shapirobacteria bacterium]|nr:ferredoxin [Candidatus Shapirobacteria bacterium]MDD5481725.1 ferredoxin [Candidatus Shapirobacteria bacterium]